MSIGFEMLQHKSGKLEDHEIYSWESRKKKNQLALINEFGKVAGHKSSM